MAVCSAFPFVALAADPVVITSNLTISETDTTYDGADLVIDGAVTVAIDGPHAFNSLLVTNRAVLTHSACTPSQTHRLDLTVAGDCVISTTSEIDATGKGYGAGRTVGSETVGGATGHSGGSYGGWGAAWAGVPSAVHGDYSDPQEWGSGGAGRAGGGRVRIKAAVLHLDGQLLADGQEADDDGAGSGGGILVEVGTLIGAGSIRAAGGINAGPSSWAWGVGGGGRIAVYATDFSGFATNQITAPDASGSPDNGEGSVWLIAGRPHTHVQFTLPGKLKVYPTNEVTFHIPTPLTDGLAVQFNNPITAASDSNDKPQIVGPFGSIAPAGIEEIGDRLYRIAFPPQTENGYYRFTLLPTLLDEEGSPLDQNANGTPGELEDAYNVTLILDTVPPRVTQHAPSGDVAGTVSSVDVWFSEAMDRATLTPSSVLISNQLGQVISVRSVQEAGLNRWRIGFQPQTDPSLYTVNVKTNVTDLAGNALTTDHWSRTTFHIVPVDLRLADVVVSTNELWAGDLVTVSWNGHNASGAPLLGDWKDAVYLSTDDKWDIRDIRLALVPHTGGLAENEVCTNTVAVAVPGLLPGNYHLLFRADIANQEQEASDEANNLVAVGPLSLSIRALTPNGQTITSTFTAESRTHYYAIILSPGESLRLNLRGTAAAGVKQLHVSHGTIPTCQQADFSATKVGEDQQLGLTGAPAADLYYVMVYGESIGIGQPYTLRATTSSIFFTSLSHYQGGNGGLLTITLHGAGFPVGPVDVRLVAPGLEDVVAWFGECFNPETALAAFDLRGAVPSERDVVAAFANGTSVALSSSASDREPELMNVGFPFRIQSGFLGKLEGSVTGPGAAGRGQVITVQGILKNVGHNDVVAAVGFDVIPMSAASIPLTYGG